MNTLATLLEAFRGGRRAALARAMSIVEDGRPECDALLAELHGAVGRARKILRPHAAVPPRHLGEFPAHALSAALLATFRRVIGLNQYWRRPLSLKFPWTSRKIGNAGTSSASRTIRIRAPGPGDQSL